MTEILTNTVAPLQNVQLCVQALQRAIDRPNHLPGMVTFYGPSGFGKSTAAAYVANRFKAYYIEAKSTWTRKALLKAVLVEMGIAPSPTIYEMTEQVSEQLALSGRPLIVDEMDHVVERNAVETIRDIYEGSSAPILLIGEERLPTKLREWERFHGRMLDWVPAEPADYEDALHLSQLYCNDIEIDPGMLEMLVERAEGSVRRICINLERVRTEARKDGTDIANVTWWGKRQLFTGNAPARRI